MFFSESFTPVLNTNQILAEVIGDEAALREELTNSQATLVSAVRKDCNGETSVFFLLHSRPVLQVLPCLIDLYFWQADGRPSVEARCEARFEITGKKGKRIIRRLTIQLASISLQSLPEPVGKPDHSTIGKFIDCCNSTTRACRSAVEAWLLISSNAWKDPEPDTSQQGLTDRFLANVNDFCKHFRALPLPVCFTEVLLVTQCVFRAYRLLKSAEAGTATLRNLKEMMRQLDLTCFRYFDENNWTNMLHQAQEHFAQWSHETGLDSDIRAEVDSLSAHGKNTVEIVQSKVIALNRELDRLHKELYLSRLDEKERTCRLMKCRGFGYREYARYLQLDFEITLLKQLLIRQLLRKECSIDYQSNFLIETFRQLNLQNIAHMNLRSKHGRFAIVRLFLDEYLLAAARNRQAHKKNFTKDINSLADKLFLEMLLDAGTPMKPENLKTSLNTFAPDYNNFMNSLPGTHVETVQEVLSAFLAEYLNASGFGR
jgi:hypothetical protein